MLYNDSNKLSFLEAYLIKHQHDNSKSNYNYNAFTYINHEFSPHFHSNYELIYVINGTFNITISGQSEKMSTGDYALVLPNRIHAFKSEGTSHIWIGVFSQQFIPHFNSKISGFEGSRFVFRCDETTDAFLREHLIFADGSTMMKKACLYAVCDQYLKNVPLEKRKSRGDQIICDILAYISEHYTENLTLTELADIFGYEYHYLSRLLNSTYQINFTDTVNKYRVEYAISLLESTTKSITDIALECGFRSIRSFNHIFKLVTGTSPTQLRNR